MAGKGINRTIMDAITPATILDPGLAGGSLRCMIDSYTGTAAETGATLTVEMGGDLPKGARVVGVTLQAAAIGAITIDVGDVVDTNRYITAAVPSNCSYIDNVTAGAGYEILTEPEATLPTNQILMTLSAACAAVVVTLITFYVID